GVPPARNRTLLIMAKNPNTFTQVPIGSSHSEVETPKPIMASPTTQVGVEQQTIQDSVMDVKATQPEPRPPAKADKRHKGLAQVLRRSLSSKKKVASSADRKIISSTFIGKINKLHSEIPIPNS